MGEFKDVVLDLYVSMGKSKGRYRDFRYVFDLIAAMGIETTAGLGSLTLDRWKAIRPKGEDDRYFHALCVVCNLAAGKGWTATSPFSRPGTSRRRPVRRSADPPANSRPKRSRSDGDDRKLLQLPGRDEPPSIHGIPVSAPVSLAAFNILTAMVEAGCLRGKRLTEAELARLSGHPNPIRTLARLMGHRKDGPAWRAMLDFPGRNGRGGYGLFTK